ncbi:hypothetical protein KTR66_19450 [Roseococcus sp. SDR]|uniref:hypothetical protein n=1 Tax=Roseococcus sp. SDR TaxID=2835532 RepID=UPI001BCD4626|nr:hypothetical protein [Roseococcus sp. SDR]MBS7792184.1 hypothetical protein [Roseococcus sp. SDR]MBV1847498.1 hypothetical protein [Roseococcus sp. SDR]
MILGSLQVVFGWVGFGLIRQPWPGLCLGLVSFSLCRGHWAERLLEEALRRRGAP